MSGKKKKVVMHVSHRYLLATFFIFWQDGNKDDMVLVRVYGRNTDALVDRDAEMRNMELLHSAGCGPPLLARFSNGIAYEFVPGAVPTVDMIADPGFNQVCRRFSHHAILQDTARSYKSCT